MVLHVLYLGFSTKVTGFMSPHFTCYGQIITTTSKKMAPSLKLKKVRALFTLFFDKLQSETVFNIVNVVHSVKNGIIVSVTQGWNSYSGIFWNKVD